MSGQTERFLEAVKRLLEGRAKLLKLRERFPSHLRFAVDNDVVMTVVAPSSRLSQPLRPLLKDENDDFSANAEAISVAERLGRFILYQVVGQGEGQLFSLPGHHSELWNQQAARIHQRLIEEVTVGGANDSVVDQVRQFREEFYEPVRQGATVTPKQLIDAVPQQLRGWLGIGPAKDEWDRLLHIQQHGVLSPFPAAMIGRRHLAPDAAAAFRRDTKAARDKWESRLTAANAEWERQGDRPSTEHQRQNIAEDAVALAYWERLNRDTFRPPGARLVLITASARIKTALEGVSADELGGDPDELAENYFLQPVDFLDECHPHLTGVLAPKNSNDDSGRFSTTLGMVDKSGIEFVTPQKVVEFQEAWGHFLRACVLERVTRQSQQHSTHLGRVRFVFQKAGISADASADNQLVVELAALGSEMLSGATDVRLQTIPLEWFTRGAPVLRLAKHPFAEALQLRSARSFCESLRDPSVQAALIEDAGGHRYTLHLHQARAFIWAGEWRTALNLCEFALAISDKVRSRSDRGVPDVDGREAMFLAAVCERHAGRGRRRALLAALDRLARFEEIAARGLQNSPRREAELGLHALRARSERHAIDVTAALAVQLRLFSERELMALLGLPRGGEPTADRPGAVSGPVLKVPSPGDLLAALRQTRREAATLSATSEEQMVSLMYLLVEQQCWIQEAQYLLLMPANETGSTKEILTGVIDSARDLAARRASSAASLDVLESPFLRIVQGVLTCVVGTATPEERDTLLQALNEQRPSGMIEFEVRRRDEFKALVAPGS